METFVKEKDTRREYEKVAIDGDTLDKRREQRAEQLEKYIWERPEQGPGIANAVTQWEKEAGSKVVPASQSVFDLEAEEKKLREVNIAHEMGKNLPPIVKRTPDQRLNSLVDRLKESEPVMQEAILKEIAGEYWKSGMPVSTEDLKVVAAHLLNKADSRKKAR